MCNLTCTCENQKKAMENQIASTPQSQPNTADEDIVEFEPKYSLNAPTPEQITTGIEQFAKDRQSKIFKCTDIKEGVLEKIGKENVDDLCNIVCQKDYSEYTNVRYSSFLHTLIKHKSLPPQNEQLQTLQDILSYYQIAANKTINFSEITLYWNHRLPPAEPAVSKVGKRRIFCFVLNQQTHTQKQII